MVTYNELKNEYLRRVAAVNESTTLADYHSNLWMTHGFLDAVEFMHGGAGRLMLAADAHYAALGIDRPMCGGMFTDKHAELLDKRKS